MKTDRRLQSPGTPGHPRQPDTQYDQGHEGPRVVGVQGQVHGGEKGAARQDRGVGVCGWSAPAEAGAGSASDSGRSRGRAGTPACRSAGAPASGRTGTPAFSDEVADSGELPDSLSEAGSLTGSWGLAGDGAAFGSGSGAGATVPLGWMSSRHLRPSGSLVVMASGPPASAARTATITMIRVRAWPVSAAATSGGCRRW